MNQDQRSDLNAQINELYRQISAQAVLQQQLRANLYANSMGGLLSSLGGLGGMGHAQGPMRVPSGSASVAAADERQYQEQLRELFGGYCATQSAEEEREYLFAPRPQPHITPDDWKPHPLVSFAVWTACLTMIVGGLVLTAL